MIIKVGELLNQLQTGNNSKQRKEFVSGSFDMLHSGHIVFFKEASSFGDLYVALGSDKTVYELKGRLPINSQEERQFMVNSVD